MSKIIVSGAIAIVLSGCASTYKAPPEGSAAMGWNQRGGTSKVQPKAIPNAKIYRMNGDFSQYVAVTLDDSRKKVVSYPAPSDVEGQQPIALAEGYYLDRRGISPSSVFTRWTYSEYAALPQAPSTQEILDNILPGALITEIVVLPYPTGTPEIVTIANHLIDAGLPDCEILYKIPIPPRR